MPRVSAAIIAEQEDIRHIYEAWVVTTGTGRNILTDDIRWKTSIHIITRECFIYPVVERVLGIEAVKERIRELDQYIDEASRQVKPEAYPFVEKLWATLPAHFNAMENVHLPALEAKLDDKDSERLFGIIDRIRVTWVGNLATPWNERYHIFKNGGHMLDTPVERMRELFSPYLPKDE
ncbi:hypothetical protein DL93DRAFT_2173780 [Clavulina sp. PMI_390]|nr:hypothetical protein DL93DRAFT_2173780 [Clavulina sp. PMI_390]